MCASRIHDPRARKRTRTVLIAACVLLSSASIVSAQPSSDWLDYRFIALDSMDLGANHNLPGKYAVVNPGGNLTVQNGAPQLAGTSARYVVADSVVLQSNASVVDVYYHTALTLTATSAVRGGPGTR